MFALVFETVDEIASVLQRFSTKQVAKRGIPRAAPEFAELDRRTLSSTPRPFRSSFARLPTLPVAARYGNDGSAFNLRNAEVSSQMNEVERTDRS